MAFSATRVVRAHQCAGPRATGSDLSVEVAYGWLGDHSLTGSPGKTHARDHVAVTEGFVCGVAWGFYCGQHVVGGESEGGTGGFVVGSS